MLIPSFTVWFSRNGSYKPLGIAYADFATREAAQRAIDELQGTMFMDRRLTVRFHVPANRKPGQKFVKEPSPGPGEEVQDKQIPGESAAVGSPKKDQSRQELSEDTLYVVFRLKIGEDQVKELFAAYDVSAVFKTRYFRQGFGFRRLGNAFYVELQLVDKTLDDVVVDLSDLSFGGKPVTVRKLYAKKAAENKKRAENAKKKAGPKDEEKEAIGEEKLEGEVVEDKKETELTGPCNDVAQPQGEIQLGDADSLLGRADASGSTN